MGHGARLKCTSTRAACARPGPGATPCPGVSARLPPSDSLPPSAPAPVPRAGGLPRCGRLFSAHGADDTCARQHAVRRRRVTGSPQHRRASRRGEGLPGAWTVLCVRAMVEHPAGDAPRLAHLTQRALVPSEHPASWASGKRRGFGAASPWPTRSCADASPAPFPRPAQGSRPAWAGSPLAGRVWHPLDDQPSVLESSHPPLPLDQQSLVALHFLSALPAALYAGLAWRNHISSVFCLAYWSTERPAVWVAVLIGAAQAAERISSGGAQPTVAWMLPIRQGPFPGHSLSLSRPVNRRYIRSPPP
jgi:hypothetical protein